MTKYAFEGDVIKLSEKDYALWKKAFCFIELDAYLVARDEYLKSLPEESRDRWMVSTSADLRNKNHAARVQEKPSLNYGRLAFKPELPKISNEEWNKWRS